MKKILFLILFFIQNVIAQVGIGTTTPRGALEVFSNDKGFLTPHVSLVSLDSSLPVVNPQGGNLVNGTLVYNVTNNSIIKEGYYYWENDRWISLLTSNNSWLINGNSNINDNNHFLGTIDNNDFVIKTNNVERMRIKSNGNIGIGVSDPTAKIEIDSGLPNISGLKFSNLNSQSVTTNGQPLGVDNQGNVVLTQNIDVYSFNNGSINFSGSFNVNDLAYSTVTNSLRTINLNSTDRTVFINYMLGFDLVGTPPAGSGSAYYEFRLFVDSLPTNNYMILQEIGSGTSMSTTISAVESLGIGSHNFEIKIKRVSNIGIASGQNQQFRPISISYNVAHINQ